MLVYRDGGRRAETHRVLADLRARAAAAVAGPDAAVSLLMAAGEFEAAAVDARSPDTDAFDELAAQLRGITVAAARNWLSGGRDSRRVAALLDRLDADALPGALSLRVAEGFAYYALYPETYALSAQRFADARTPALVSVLGIRSIGTSLSAVVVAALERRGCDVRSRTVRPRGHPFDRTLSLTPEFADALRADAANGALFAVVDEGPGISGSSFAGVVSCLERLGVDSSRIALFPSWDPEPARLKSDVAARVWRDYPRYCASASEAGITPERAFGVETPSIDFSAGQWRRHVFASTDEWPAVQPQHERWKALIPGTRQLLKFAGLGPYGEAAYARAAALADEGLGVAPSGLRQGFIALPFVDGSPLRASGGHADAHAIGRYIGRVAAAFPAAERVDRDALRAMVHRNLESLSARLPALDLPDDLPACAIDGRMLAHEWIRSNGALVKVDALDHHRDHFFPGVQSPAWDLAGAEIELSMDAGQVEAMLNAFERASGERRAREVLPFYRLAYAAFRYGYASLAADTLAGGQEAARFSAAATRYSQWALKAAASLTAASKSPRKQIARSSMKT